MTNSSGIKVLHIIKSFKLGGAETNLRNFVAASKDRGWETHVAYSVGGEFEDWFRENGVQLFKYAQKDYKVKSPATLAIVWRLAAYMRRQKIRLVHTHNYSAHVWGGLAAKLAGAKVIEHVHDFRYEEPDYNRERGVNPSQFRWIKQTARLSDRVVVLTQNNRAFLHRHGIAGEDKIRTVLNGIDVAQKPQVDTRAVRERLGIGPDKRILLSAARLSKEKNIGLIVKIAQILKSADLLGPNILFLIAGDGPERAALEAQVKEAGLTETVRFTGFYPDVPKLLAISEMFLQPTLLELHSITMLEAMAMEVPVLVSRGVGSNDDLISDGKDGFLLNPHDAKAWAEKISGLLADPIWAEAIGKQGYELVREKCSMQRTVAEFETMYRELEAA